MSESKHSKFFSRFQFGDKVIVDGNESIKATVIGFAFYPHGLQVQVGWFANGSSVEAWMADWRLGDAA